MQHMGIVEHCMISSDWGNQIFEKKKKKKIGSPSFGQVWGSQLGFLPFSEVWFISFPWNWIQW